MNWKHLLFKRLPLMLAACTLPLANVAHSEQGAKPGKEEDRKILMEIRDKVDVISQRIAQQQINSPEETQALIAIGPEGKVLQILDPQGNPVPPCKRDEKGAPVCKALNGVNVQNIVDSLVIMNTVGSPGCTVVWVGGWPTPLGAGCL